MKNHLPLLAPALFFSIAVHSQTRPVPKYFSMSTHEFQYSKTKRIKTNYTNSGGDFVFYSDNKIFPTPFSQYDIQFCGFTKQVTFSKESDSSGYMAVNKVPAGFKIYTLQYRNNSFYLDSVVPDSQGTLRMYFVSKQKSDKALFIGSFLQNNASFWTVNVLYESSGNIATSASDDVTIYAPGKNRLLRSTNCDNCSNGFFVFYGKSFMITDKKGFQKSRSKFR